MASSIRAWWRRNKPTARQRNHSVTAKCPRGAKVQPRWTSKRSLPQTVRSRTAVIVPQRHCDESLWPMVTARAAAATASSPQQLAVAPPSITDESSCWTRCRPPEAAAPARNLPPTARCSKRRNRSWNGMHGFLMTIVQDFSFENSNVIYVYIRVSREAELIGYIYICVYVWLQIWRRIKFLIYDQCCGCFTFDDHDILYRFSRVIGEKCI